MIFLNKEIELIVSDFDGVMTDNTFTLDENGIESVRLSRADGLAVGLFKNAGLRFMLLSSEKNPIVEKRANKLKIDVIFGTDNKLDALLEYCTKNEYSLDNVLYIGNDLNDLEVMKKVGVSVSVNDAADSIKSKADLVLKTNGGKGAIRELYKRMVGN